MWRKEIKLKQNKQKKKLMNYGNCNDISNFKNF